MKKTASALKASLLGCVLCLLPVTSPVNGAHASEANGAGTRILTWRPSDYRPWGQDLPLLLAAGQNVGHEQTPSDARTKSPLAAGLLGGVLGYGSGQYYCRRWKSGTAFLVLDGVGTFLLARGVDIVNSDNGPTNLRDIEEDTTDGVIYLSFGAVTLAGSHIAQAILGPRAARRHNQALPGTKTGRLSPFVRPGVNSVALGFSVDF